MPYNQSDYDTAIAAFRTLPETMAVENLISIRQQNEQNSLQLNKMKNEMKRDQEEIDGFAAFNDEVRNKGIDLTNQEAASSSVGDIRSKYLGNKKVQEAADSLIESSNAISAGRKNRFESRNMDDEEATRPLRNELLNRKVRLSIGETELAEKQLKILAEDQDANVKANFSNLAGQISRKYPDIGQKAAEWGEFYGDDEKMAPHVREIGRVIGSLAKANGLEEANAYALAEMQGAVSGLRNAGIELNPNLPPDVLEANYEKARNRFPVGSSARKDTEELISGFSSYYNSLKTREALAKNLSDILSERPDISTDQAKKEYASKLAGISNKFGVLSGIVDRDWADKKSAQDRKEASDADKKKQLEFDKLAKDIKNSSDAVAIRKLAAHAQLNGLKREAAMDMLKLSLGKDGKANPDKIKGSKELLDNFDAAFDLNAAPKSILEEE